MRDEAFIPSCPRSRGDPLDMEVLVYVGVLRALLSSYMPGLS